MMSAFLTETNRLRIGSGVLARPPGRTADDPDLDAVCVRNDLAAGESAFANFIADALASRCQTHGHAADLAFVDATSIRTGIPVAFNPCNYSGPAITFCHEDTKKAMVRKEKSKSSCRRVL